MRTAPINNAPTMKGFSLMELAVVLTIVGILLSGVLMAVSQSTENTRRIETRTQLEGLMRALHGFAQANGRLPCPALPSSAGQESPLGGGACSVAHGFVPARTLGFNGSLNDDSLLVDAWGNPLRYSVSPLEVNGGTPAFTTAAGLSWLYQNGPLTAYASGLFNICDNDCSVAGDILADTVPVVLLSMGNNWAIHDSADEAVNAGATTLAGYEVKEATDLNFVATGYSEENFDDILLWMSPYILYTRMISAGRLP